MFCEPSPALYRYIYYIYSGQKEIRKFLKTLFNFRPGLFFDQMSEGGLDRLSVSRINNFLLFYVVTAVSVPLWLGSTQLNEINPKKWRLEDIFYTSQSGCITKVGSLISITITRPAERNIEL